MATYYSPKIVTDGLVLCLDAGNTKSYPARCFVSAKIYSVYNGGVRSANYTVQYSDDNTNWTTAFSGVARNNESGSATCGINNNTGSGSASYGRRRYWRYVEGSAVVSHHPRVSRIILVDDANIEYDLIVYVSDNCSDSGTYIVGTVSVDVGSTTWTDLSGNGYNGILNGGASYNLGSNGCISVDGVDDYILVGPVPNTGNSTSSVSWCIWVYPSSTTGNIMSMSNINPQGSWNMPPIAATGQTFRGKIWSNNYLYSSTYILNTWYYVVMVFDYTNSSQNLYVNGSLVATQSSISYGASGASNYMFLGQSNPGADNTGMFTGRYGLFQIYTNKALNINEVLQNYNATKGRFGL